MTKEENYKEENDREYYGSWEKSQHLLNYLNIFSFNFIKHKIL